MWLKKAIIDELKLGLCQAITTSCQIMTDIFDTMQKEVTFTQFKRKSIFSEDLRNTR